MSVYIYVYIYNVLENVINDLQNTAYWIVINKLNSEAQVQRHFDPIECIQCSECLTRPVVLLSGTMPTDVK